MVLAKKKKPKRKGVLDLINQALEMAVTSSKTQFTPADIRRYYMTGMKARQEREPRLAKTTPKRVQAKRRETAALGIHPKMDIVALGNALELATELEEATLGKKWNPKRWLKG